VRHLTAFDERLKKSLVDSAFRGLLQSKSLKKQSHVTDKGSPD
jgi:hypothetical protein